jgi:3-oxoacyl-[acyl-carrier-protein] synthase II
MRRVVVTGLGALTPIGNNLHDYWEGLEKGLSGAVMISGLILRSSRPNLHVN